MHWSLFGCLLGAWIVICLCLIKGVRVSGKYNGNNLQMQDSRDKLGRAFEVL